MKYIQGLNVCIYIERMQILVISSPYHSHDHHSLLLSFFIYPCVILLSCEFELWCFGWDKREKTESNRPFIRFNKTIRSHLCFMKRKHTFTLYPYPVFSSVIFSQKDLSNPFWADFSFYSRLNLHKCLTLTPSRHLTSKLTQSNSLILHKKKWNKRRNYLFSIFCPILEKEIQLIKFNARNYCLDTEIAICSVNRV
jgi:hypothetical protein